MALPEERSGVPDADEHGSRPSACASFPCPVCAAATRFIMNQEVALYVTLTDTQPVYNLLNQDLRSLGVMLCILSDLVFCVAKFKNQKETLNVSFLFCFVYEKLQCKAVHCCLLGSNPSSVTYG